MAAARPDTWMPLYIGDYLADTLHLTREQHGSYLLLIFALWRGGGALADDDRRLAAIAKATARQWKDDRAVLKEFFIVADGVWRHKRVDEELAAADAFIRQRQGAGQASAEQRRRQREGNGRSTGGQRDGQREGKTSPSPSPVATTSTVADSARESGDWVPEAEPDGIEPPEFLRRTPIPSVGRAAPLAPGWQPSEDAEARLRKARPDLTPERIEQRTGEFRNWCAEVNKHSHDFDATWLNFMVKTNDQRTGSTTRGGNTGANLAALAEFGRTGTG